MKNFEVGRKTVMHWDFNAKMGNEKVESIVGGWGLICVNVNGKFLVDLCAERGMFVANNYFEYRLIRRYTWRRDGGRSEKNASVDYMIINERIKKCWMQR